MPALEADAELRVAPGSLEVRSFTASGGKTSVRAEYAKHDGHKEGAVLMDLGWIDLGYDLSDGGTGLKLIGPASWYARKTAAMRDEAAVAARGFEDAQELARDVAMNSAQRTEHARALAARCAADARSCDGAAIEILLDAATNAVEKGSLRGITYAPMVIAAAKGGVDGTTLDPLVMGSVALALSVGGESTLDHIPAGSGAAERGTLIGVRGWISRTRREGPYWVGTLTTGDEPVYFVTPFAVPTSPNTSASFRGVFVQRYASVDQPPSRVLVGAFGP